jgi:hypothetical protein
MIYPIPTRSYKKKPKKKVPWLVVIIVLLAAFGAFFLFYTHSLLFESGDMTESIVDFLFLVEDKNEVFFIRSNKQQKISYAVQMPLKSFEPIQAVSLDQKTPQGIYTSIEKLFGRANRSFWATIQSSDFTRIRELGRLSKNTVVQDQEIGADIQTFIELIQALDISYFEFVFFSKMKALQNIFELDNFNNRSTFRLVDQLSNYAYKATPVSFLTKKPVRITYQSGNTKEEAERFYLDDKSLKSIKEFMTQ